MMGRPLRMSAPFRFFGTVALLLLLTPSRASSALGDFTYPYESIFSPLLRALSEHGGSRWNPELKKKMKPEPLYVKYLTEMYKKPSRSPWSLDGSKVYNTVRLIKPQDECLARSNEGEPVTLSSTLSGFI